MAIQSITEINLDINQPFIEVVHAKQYDTVRQVKAHLFYNGVKWYVPTTRYTAVVAFKKSDRIGGFYDTTEEGIAAVSVDSSDRSIITILLDRNTVTTEGQVSVEITFYDTSGTYVGRLSTFSFYLNVEGATLTELDLASNPYFNVLAQDIAAVLQAEENLTGVTASATKLAAGSNPTVTVTGGVEEGNPYHFAFGIPKGDTGKGISSNTVTYAVNTDPNTIPSSGWVSNITSLTIPDGAVVWTKVVQKFTDNNSSTWYAQAVQGSPGPAGIAVQTTAPETSVKAWINPDEYQIISIPDASECNPIHYTKTISALPYTISDSRITTQMRVINCVFGTPTNVGSDISWSTDTAGQLVLTGTLNGSTTVDIDLQVCIS